MKVLVDTCVWSLALRRNDDQHSPPVLELRELIKEFRVQLTGPIRQELLSGIKDIDRYLLLRDHLRAFTDLPVTTADYELAAEYFNISRSRGIQGANTDFLLCALSVRNDLPIFTTDNDFALYQQQIPIKLHFVRTDFPH
jgi:predicted nucleic acid-binding protein